VDIGKIFSTVAPFLATALGTIGGPIGVAAAGILGGILGTKDTDPDKLITAVTNATPDQLAQIRKADQDFQIRMQELGIQSLQDFEALAEKDRESARNRQIAMKDQVPAILAIILTIAFLGILIMIERYGVPESGHDVIMTMIGAIAGAWVSAMAFFFGTNSSSARKTELLSQAPAVQAPPK
jgi:hypothetical protein